MSLRLKMPQDVCGATGIREIASPKTEGLGLRYIHFGTLSILEGEERFFNFGPLETCMVVLGGEAVVGWEDVSCMNAESRSRKVKVGQRSDVFGGKPWAMYSRPNTTFSITGVSSGRATEIAVIRAEPAAPDPCFSKRGQASVSDQTELDPGMSIVTPDMISTREVGRGPWRREIRDIVVRDWQTGATRLIVGETLNPAGNWSSYPPHKHDEEIESQESELEEVYHFRVRPSQGFGMIRIYSPSRGVDEAYAVEDGDTVAIPYGYHPVAAAPGYEIYYLWALAGRRRTVLTADDPKHAWVAETEAGQGAESR